MSMNLWSKNHPRDFWGCQPNPSDEVWQKAIEAALPVLGLETDCADADSILALTLGEARFGPDHWRLSPIKQMYYSLKPFLPRALMCQLRRAYHRLGSGSNIPFPIDSRYAAFLWNVLTCVLQQSPGQKILVRSFWPECKHFAFVLTHDIEGEKGQQFARTVADLEEEMGFRSSFNFVPEKYSIDEKLVDELHQRGFEVGIHGLKHDGKLFSSHEEFMKRVQQINRHIQEFKAAGFRSPLTHRNPEWMQALKIKYDLSFFDTDPFEPMPGGAMTIWPFFLGRFVELPYTLVQDYTLTDVLHENTPRLWLDKVEFIRKYRGMALVNSHPDYLSRPPSMNIYRSFLCAMQGYRYDMWHALPREVSEWWCLRAHQAMQGDIVFSVAELDEGILSLS